MKTMIHQMFVCTVAVLGWCMGANATPVDVRVSQILQTKWGQTTDSGYNEDVSCFNYYITTFRGSNAIHGTAATNDYAGCLTVAVGQIAKHHRLGSYYNWDMMPDDTSTGMTDAKRQAIGRLMADLAASFTSHYTPTGTYANVARSHRAILAATNRFHFADCETMIFNPSNFPFATDKLTQTLVPSLDYGMPAVLALACTSDDTVHEVAIDGYGYDKDGQVMFHANVGAYGSYDNWFYPDKGLDIDGHHYQKVNSVIFNLIPDKAGTLISGRVLDSSKRALEGANVTLKNAAGATVQTTKTNSKGIYAFLVPLAGSYTIIAAKDASSDKRLVEVVANRSRQLDDDSAEYLGEDHYWEDAAHVPIIGNQRLVDFVLKGYYEETVATPKITPVATSLQAKTTVSIACATEGAVIRYTIDGSEPTTSSPIYTKPFAITDSITVKAVAFKLGLNASEVAVVNYQYGGTTTLSGDDAACPMMLIGTNVARTVANYVAYTRAATDPVLEQAICDFAKITTTENNSSWFTWTAPGDGIVSIVAAITGPGESGYSYDEETGWSGLETLIPYYGTIMRIDENGTTVTNIVSTLVDGEKGKKNVDSPDVAYAVLKVRKGAVYTMFCECPYRLGDAKKVSYSPFYYTWSGKAADTPVLTRFDSANAYLSMTLNADVETETTQRFVTIPAVPRTTLAVKKDDVTVGSAAGKYALDEHTSYAVVYTADAGYEFTTAQKTWTVYVKDETGFDYDLASRADCPKAENVVVRTQPEEPTQVCFAEDGVSAAYDIGTEVTRSQPRVVTNGHEIVTCVGWVGTGDVPAQGAGSTVTFTLTQDSSLTWQFETTFVTYAVTFDLGEYGTRTGGGALSQTVAWGASASEPAFDSAYGWKFVGWDRALGPITGDVTLVAQWERERASIASEEPTAIEEGASFAAATYDGVLYDESNPENSVVGTIQVKAAKAKVKSQTATTKLTISIQLVSSTKKISISGDYDLTSGGEQKFEKSGNAVTLVLGKDSLTGTYGKYLIEAVANAWVAKSAAASTADATYVGAYNLMSDEGLFVITVAKKGKVKVTGAIPVNGKTAKVSVTTQLLVNGGVACIPVIAPKQGLSFSIWLGENAHVEGLTNARIGKPGTLIQNAKFRLELDPEQLETARARLATLVGGEAAFSDYFPDGIPVVQSGKKWVVMPNANGKAAAAGKIVLDKSGAIDTVKSKLDGFNVSGLKLTYTAKTGAFKGSFKVYVNKNGKAATVNVTVEGALIDGKGYGTITVKNKGSLSITIE